ncbi:MAG: hypothetical protein EHM93_20140 [Bacteroidales bacterium]|nr:MAG: hypothetical protein EHM93_20140 [Bacteroidales bacterium]
MRYYTICIITAISVNAFSQVTNKQVQQNQTKVVKIKGIDIPLNEIPLQGVYFVPTSKLKSNPNKESGVDQQRVYASEGRKRFAVATDQVITIKAEKATESDMQEDRTLFEMYSSNSKLLWSTSQKECISNEVYLSDDGDYTHIIWISSSEGTEGHQKLISYDKNGKELLAIDNIGSVIPNRLNTIIYYRLRINPTSYDLTKTLYCYNFLNNEKWEKVFESKSSLFESISGSGNRSICLVDSSLYSLDEHGKLLWQKKFLNATVAFLSYDGDFFLRSFDKVIEVYNNSNQKMIFRKEFNDINVVCARFVNNSIIAIETNTAPGVCFIDFYSIKGELLDKEQIVCGVHSLIINETSKDIYGIYTDDIKRIEYKVK